MNAPVWPSLLLVNHHNVQREQPQQHNNIHEHQHNHRHLHQHQHQRLHRRQTDTEAAVTEVQTVSVVQQIEVDADGNTVTTVLTPVATPTSPTTTDALPTTTDPANTNATPTDVGASSTQSVSTLSSGQSAAVTSAPSASIPTTSFASFSVSSNSTTLISSSSSLPASLSLLSNSTISSSSSNSLSSTTFAYLTSSSASSGESTATSTESSYPFSSPYATTTDIPGIIAGGATGINSGAAASSTSASSDGADSSDDGVASTPVIVGSVVSSVAGAAFIILALIFIWRWRKRSRTMLPLGSGGNVGAGNERSIHLGPSNGPQMIEASASHETPIRSESPSIDPIDRRSFAYAFPAALAHLTGYKRASQKVETGTISSTAGSERGFYRVSGRKLPSVLQHGGDGYGGGINEIADGGNTLSGTSFYSDHEGFHGGPGSPTHPPPLANPTQRDSGVPVMRPSPARTPVTEQGFFTDVPPPLSPPIRPDVLGRSRPSQDGSHTSKFTEEV